MRRAGEIRIGRGNGYDEYEEHDGYDEALEIARDLMGLAFSLGVMVLIVFRAGGWL
jgi:hypothetical protein